MKKIGQMRLAKPGLPGQERHAKSSPLYPAEQFQAESLMHLRNIHLWKIRHEQYSWEFPYFPWQCEKA
jgi:hypothetical protein